MKNNILKTLSIGLASMAALSSCSDQFLEDKKNYDNVNTDVYNYYEGSLARVSDVYGWCLPNCNVAANWKYPSSGVNDDMAKSTEEYTGFGAFVNPENVLTATSSNAVPDYFMGDPGNIQSSVYGRIRNINDVIQGISGSSLPESQKDELLGQVYFFRAWCYYSLAKWYGGVPLVKKTLDPTENAVTPRSSAKETIEFILEDLDQSIKMLDGKKWGGADYGRVTSSTARALRGRVLLLWASPLFNRANDKQRWTDAYSVMHADKEAMEKAGHKLYQDANNVNGRAFAHMFTDCLSDNPEYVFFTNRSNVMTNAEEPYNDWEARIRPRNTTGLGNYTPSKTMIDLFPMSDGKVPSNCETYTKLEKSQTPYEEAYPFMDRDPRFYRTFAFPGFRWAYDGDPTAKNGNNPSYDNGKNYELWSYVWYTSTTAAGDAESGDAYGADNLLKEGNKSVYLRKRSDDADINSKLYTWDANNSFSPFRWSGQPYVEIRYAEVLLNYAEVACMSGNMKEAVDILKSIRQRAGYEAGAEGLSANLETDEAACMSAILYERQIELAYEGKRFDDMRRWLLFDGGAEFSSIQGAPASWTLTGFGGNTCTWLGVKPLNGTRRENMLYRTADAFGVGGTTYDSDPLLKANVARCAAVDLNKLPLSDQLIQLKSWYEANLVQKVSSGDGRASDHTALYIKYQPKYYLLGLTMSAMQKNVALPQTIGWENMNDGGANGTFDPLAE